MELLRAVLQPSINEEIRGVFNKYMKVRAAGWPHGPGRPVRPPAAGVRPRAGSRAPRCPAWPGCGALTPSCPPPQFFQKAAINVRDNVGEEVDPEQLIQETCRSCLEQVGTSARGSAPGTGRVGALGQAPPRPRVL